MRGTWKADSQTRTDRDSLVESATWRRFMIDTRRVEILVDGCRVRSASTATDGATTVDCWLSLVNRDRVPLSGHLRWDQLPSGWAGTADRWDVPLISPNQTGRAVISATMSNFGARGGHVPVDALLATSDGQVLPIPLRVCLLSAERLSHPITMDGDLSDWSPGGTNAALDFRLITPEPARKAADAPTHPRWRTSAFVARDQDALFVAVNCEKDPHRTLAPGLSNFVAYDDLVPVGEELVEILIDPLNAGTRTPTDLYRLVVKPTSAHFAERGIILEPPCGPRRPWAADARVATKIEDERWTVEVRIPWRAFDNAPVDHALWGFNITRFDAATAQFSTWSGATGNAYDPLSVGNLYLPDAANP